MNKNFFFLILIFLFFTPIILIAKSYYLITLKGGTEIKVDSIEEHENFIKAYKFGGYIIYQKNNIKSIQLVNDYSYQQKQQDRNIDENNYFEDKIENQQIDDKQEDMTNELKNASEENNEKNLSKNKSQQNINKPQQHDCNPSVQNVEILPIYNKKTKKFDLKVTGSIDNQCDFNITDATIKINFYNNSNEIIFTKDIQIGNIDSYETKNFTQIFPNLNIDKVKYYTYKLEFLK